MSKAPKLRFKEFSGDWESDRLSKVCDINPKTSQIPDKFYYIDLESVVKGELIKENIITKDEAPSRAQRVLSEGDTLFQTVRPYQNNNYYFSKERDLSTVASTGYAQLRSYRNSEFLYHLIHTSRFGKNVLLRCTGSNYPAINTADLSEIEIYYPSLEEQEKISSFFSLIDDKISLQGEKVEALKDYKKGMMQKIFSRELRFKDDEGIDYPDWEEKKIKDIDVYISDGNYGEAYPTSSDMVDEGIPFLRGNNIDNGYLNFNDMKYITPEKHSELLSGHIKSKDIIITVRGDIGKVGFATDEYDGANMNAQLALIRVMSDNIDARYIHQYMNTIEFYKEVLKRQTGTALKQLPIGKLKDICLKLPTIEEQSKIATILCKLDNKIEKEQEKLNSLNEYKKGLLQQMFV